MYFPCRNHPCRFPSAREMVGYTPAITNSVLELAGSTHVPPAEVHACIWRHAERNAKGARTLQEVERDIWGVVRPLLKGCKVSKTHSFYRGTLELLYGLPSNLPVNLRDGDRLYLVGGDTVIVTRAHSRGGGGEDVRLELRLDENIDRTSPMGRYLRTIGWLKD